MIGSLQLFGLRIRCGWCATTEWIFSLNVVPNLAVTSHPSRPPKSVRKDVNAMSMPVR